MTDDEVRDRVAALDAELDGLSEMPAALDAVQSLVALYGEALTRLVHGADPRRDELLVHLLSVHDIEVPTLLQITPLEVRSAVA
ncbi:MAG TPA: hypothetical protein VHW65_08825 [Gemmatimonadales bacterium]|jgi:hypothetical protein|nr:hypothetical protein [Gemmatimonadales bacterium]